MEKEVKSDIFFIFLCVYFSADYTGPGTAKRNSRDSRKVSVEVKSDMRNGKTEIKAR